LAEWLFERGIGEDRAILIDDGAIIEAQVERPGLRAGSVVEARLTAIQLPGRRGIATMADGTEILVTPLPLVTEGAAVRVKIVREAIPEPGAVKRAKGWITIEDPAPGPDLATRIGPHRMIGPHDADAFETAGWSELLEAAAYGVVRFREGALRTSLTPAMTLIDIDGERDAATLSVAGARAAAQAIRRFGITGNIGIDLPTVQGKEPRAAAAAQIDAVLPRPFERTAVNGFGFLQIVRPRVRASLCEMVQYDPAGAEARALIRRVQRSGAIGAVTMDAPADVRSVIDANPDWTAALERQIGGRVTFS
jgi:hypothetical protein